jgi:hexosaminidase
MLDAIVGELTTVFPFPYIHIGGDEVDHKAWEGCPRCKALMEREKITSLAHIQRYFTARYEEILRKHGRKMIGWNEILDDKLSKSTAVMAWQNDVPGYKAATGGWNVVFCPGQHCYFDMKESPRDSWGMAWAGIVPLSAAYNFDPLARPGLSDEQKKRVMGVQACLWTEFITSNERGDYKIWPRLCALAELAWTPQPRRNFADFMDRLGPAHLDRLALLGVAFRVPDPEVNEVAPGLVRVTPPFAGAEIHYTTDGSEPTEKSPRWTGEPISSNSAHPVKVMTIMPSGRTSHAVTLRAVKK